MISDQNMAYGVNDILFLDLKLVFFRVQVLEVQVDFGGHYILIGYLFHNEYVMHKNQESILIRACLRQLLSREVEVNCGSLVLKDLVRMFFLDAIDFDKTNE